MFGTLPKSSASHETVPDGSTRPMRPPLQPPKSSLSAADRLRSVSI